MKRFLFSLLAICTLTALKSGGLNSGQIEDSSGTRNLENYLSLYQQGTKGVDLYYNIALAYERNLDYPHSLLFTEKALRWDPSCKACKMLRSRVQQKAELADFSLPGFSPLQQYKTIAQSLPSVVWFGMASLLLSLFIYLHVYKKKAALKYLVLMFALLCFVNSWINEHARNEEGYFILMKPADLHWSPDDKSKVKTKVPPGMKLKETDRIGSWGKFQTQEYDEGWLPLSLVEKIDL